MEGRKKKTLGIFITRPILIVIKAHTRAPARRGAGLEIEHASCSASPWSPEGSCAARSGKRNCLGQPREGPCQGPRVSQAPQVWPCATGKLTRAGSWGLVCQQLVTQEMLKKIILFPSLFFHFYIFSLVLVFGGGLRNTWKMFHLEERRTQSTIHLHKDEDSCVKVSSLAHAEGFDPSPRSPEWFCHSKQNGNREEGKGMDHT